VSKAIRKLVIVGGGTAGWITAGTIAAHFQDNARDEVSITLVESPNVPIIGVGEGTWPTMRTTLKNMGISETDFIRECDATFKQGAKFAKWTTGADDDFYYHPLELPVGFLESNLVPHWMQHKDKVSFADAVCTQSHICEESLAPKQIVTPEYQSVANYAYHLDAGKFSGFIQAHCVNKLGVTHILADMTSINTADNGDIASIETEQAGTIEGDLFIDCTGFKSLLLGEHYDVPFIDCSDVLFIDTALAVHAPYETPETEIASHTISTAQDAGWIWDIGLSSRRGVGHVYSSRHTTQEKAERQLRDYLKPRVKNADDLDVRKLPIRSGHREKFWQNNVVAIGLSAGFLEPLEASAIVLVELSARLVAEQLPPSRDVMDIVAKRFNQRFRYRWDRIIDFLKLHYCITQRSDSQFWIDNKDPETIPESLKELLELWRFQYPWQDDFTQKDEVFPSASYQYVLYGMGFETRGSFHDGTHHDVTRAQAHFSRNQNATQAALGKLPSHRDLINKIQQYGMQKI